MAQKMTKNQLRRAKKKEQKKAQSTAQPEKKADVDTRADDVAKPEPIHAKSEPSPEPDIDSFGIDIDDDPRFSVYKSVFDRFAGNDTAKELWGVDKGEVYYSDEDEIPEDVPKAKNAKKRRQESQLSIAELKALARKPDIVEWTDPRSAEPTLLVHLKAYRNVVPVPAHWSLKREYLSTKRGVEKQPFALPKFIKDTGISEMRDAVLEKQAEATLKQKQRERVQPKMGRLDIDYQKLYEAFFRFQTKPELTRFGEVYYEGKEYETNLKHLRPGDLSDELKEALNMPQNAPPPWLINMQRAGPPPSYPALRIPGLNAPPPAGASWGFHPGGYGKPPVDEFNRPLYGGDIFGVLQPAINTQTGEPIERELWGELQPPEEESDEEEEESEAEADEADEDGEPIHDVSGLETPGGLESTVPTEHPAEVNVSGDFDLRKQRPGTDTDEASYPRQAYTVVQERQIRSEGFFGGDRAYDIRGSQNAHLPVLGQEDENRKRKKPGDVDVAIDPDALMSEDGISKEELRKRYDAQKKEEKAPWGFEEDLSDMIAEERRKRFKRDEDRQKDKRERSFKF